MITRLLGDHFSRRNPIPEYRRFVPQGPLLRKQRRLMATFIVSLVVSMLGLGFGAGVVWSAAEWLQCGGTRLQLTSANLAQRDDRLPVS